MQVRPSLPNSRPAFLALAFALGTIQTLVAGNANLTEAEAKARSKRVSEVSYEITLDLDQGKPRYRGNVEVRFTLSTAKGAKLFLDFQGEKVENLWINGKDRGEAKIDAASRIFLPEADLRPGSNTVRVRYQNDYDSDGAGLHKIVDPADQAEYVYTQFEPFDANRLFPCFDQPDLKATYEMTAKVPFHWVAVSNGREAEVSNEGEKRVYRFAKTERFSPYIVAIAAGPFRQWTDLEARVPSRLYVTQSMAPHADPENIFRVTRQGFDFFEKYFELPYPFHKYDQIFVPQFNWGAMENVGCVIFNDRMIFRHKPTEAERMRRANTILHEMAHMWFGDIVTMKWWNDLWLNESFATYMANLGLVEATEFRSAWESFFRRTKGWAYWQDQLPTTHPIETPVPDTRTTFTNFDGITYGKGASVLKQLAFLVGPEAFRKGVANYLAKYKWKNATRADFIQEIGKASGNHLKDWTRLWLQSSGVNTIVPSYEVQDGKIKNFRLLQKPGNGDRVLRIHKLQVALYEFNSQGILEPYEVTEAMIGGEEEHLVQLEGKRAPAFVDANHGDHAFAKVFLDPRSLEFARKNLEFLPSSLLRSVVWRTVDFMVRDAEMDPRESVELFLQKVANETDGLVLGNRRDSLFLILESYLPDSERAKYMNRVRTLATKQVGKVVPGGDLQRIWFEIQIASSRSESHGDALRDYLIGEEAIEGLEFDAELRWRMVRRLAAIGHPSARYLLDAEAARDGSERGKKAAYRARVSLPDSKSKEEAFQAFLTDKETALDILREGMKGFWVRDQAEDFSPYVERYFGALEKIEKERGQYYAESFTWRLFPGVLVNQEVLDAAQKAVGDASKLSNALKRAVKESADDLARALRIRKKYDGGKSHAK